MKATDKMKIWAFSFAIVFVSTLCTAQDLSGTAFSYQGYLNEGLNPANGLYDFECTLFGNDQPSTWIVGMPFVLEDQLVTNGLFTLSLDFGANTCKGQTLWLGLGVRPGAETGSFADLMPHQPLSAAPLALALPGLYTDPSTVIPNVIGGDLTNNVTEGVYGATISGGGPSIPNTDLGNKVTDHYGTVSGGGQNQAGNNFGLVYDANFATVGGGFLNTSSGPYATVAGGFGNDAEGDQSFIGGGNSNSVKFQGAIAGGSNNSVDGSVGFIGAGYKNDVDATGGVISGGRNNWISADYGFIGGGGPADPLSDILGNAIYDSYGTIGGGADNTIGTDEMGTTIDTPYATVGGGLGNWAAGEASTVAGGSGNSAEDAESFIGGGMNNKITASQAAISGGFENRVASSGGFVGAGQYNYTGGQLSVIVGGARNGIYSKYGFIGGGGPPDQDNLFGNEIFDPYGTIGGGSHNSIGQIEAGPPELTPYATVGGGLGNWAAGEASTVAGGEFARAEGYASSIPGGSTNWATGDYSFAAGRRAKAAHDGVFAWADSTDADFTSGGEDQFIIRASGGVGIDTGDPQGKLHIKTSGWNDSHLYLEDAANSARYSRVLQASDGLIFRNYFATGSTTAFSFRNLNDTRLLSIEGNGNVGIGTYNPNSKLEVVGDIHSTNEITKAYTSGTSNPAAPFAYGSIHSDGYKISGTPNVSVVWNSTDDVYEITLTNVSYNASDFATTVTPVSVGTPILVTTGATANKLIVYLYDISGNAVQNSFHFIVFKP